MVGNDWILLLGFFAQALFGARMLSQWLISERSRKVITPVIFWVLSLVASLLMFIYGYLRNDFPIMLGQSLTYFIYIRNLQLKGQWKRSPLVLRLLVWFTPVIFIYYYFNNNVLDLQLLFQNEHVPIYLMVLGISAQLLFTSRFIYQWMHSEQNKKSELPLGFWVLSIIGSMLILCYAIMRVDWVLIFSHTLGMTVYTRNYILIRR